MESYFLGEVIKKRRQELGLTQDQLCEGICEPITISRLENGKQTPSRNRINAILERLDLPPERYIAFLSKSEVEVEALQEKIVAYNVRFEKALPENRGKIRQEALQLHKRLEEVMEKEDTLSQQLILRSQVILGKEDGPYSHEEEIQLLLDAIHLTSPGFNLEHIDQGLYTAEEVKIINHLAITYSACGDSLQALDILRQLYQYMMRHRGTTASARKYVAMVAFHYARELDVLGRYQDAIHIALEGRKICLDNGNYFTLSDLLSVLAECYHFLGEDEKSKDYYFQTYYLGKAVGDEYNIANTIKEAREYIGLEFET